MRITKVTKAKGGKKWAPAPRRDECLQCKTKSHAYWSQTCPLFIAWLQKKDRQRQHNEGSNKGGRFSADYALPQQVSPSAIAPVCLQVSTPPSVGASETANILQALQATIELLKAK